MCVCVCGIAGLRLDDLVATPVGAGYLRGYRREDGFCIVLYPWGHGFVHVTCVNKLDDAVVTQRKKRKFTNEYLSLEHQHLYEDVESLLENYPPEQAATAEGDVEVTPEGVNLADYKKLVESLEEEVCCCCALYPRTHPPQSSPLHVCVCVCCFFLITYVAFVVYLQHFDAEILQHDLSFVRRVQALAAKTQQQHHHDDDDDDDDDDPEQHTASPDPTEELHEVQDAASEESKAAMA